MTIRTPISSIFLMNATKFCFRLLRKYRLACLGLPWDAPAATVTSMIRFRRGTITAFCPSSAPAYNPMNWKQPKNRVLATVSQVR